MARVNDEAGSGDLGAGSIGPRDMDQTRLAQSIEILRAKHGHQSEQTAPGFVRWQAVDIVVLEPREWRAATPRVDEKSGGHHALQDSRYTEGIRRL